MQNIDTTNHIKGEKSKLRLKGIMMAVSAGILWGIQSNVVDYLLSTSTISLDWLVNVRIFFSGIILLVILLFNKKPLFGIWTDLRDSLNLILFAIFGLLGLQYSFFSAIQYSNAATAAIIQYLAPSLILIYACFVSKRLPTLKEVLALTLTFFGLFLLVTNGEITQLTVSLKAFFWGVVSAVTLAIYSTHPKGLIKKYGSDVIVMWAMIIGSIVLSLKPHSFHPGISFTFVQIVIVLFITVTTLLSFYLYLASLSYITSSEASVLTISEPISALLISIIFMGIAIGTLTLFGGIIIISVVIYMGKSPIG